MIPGLGAGQFGNPISSPLPQAALSGVALFSFHSAAVADFNRDGKLDLVLIVGNSVAGAGALLQVDMVLLLGTGDGSFQPASIISAPEFDGFNVVSADFNGDGIPDLATDSYQAGITGAEPANLQIFLGNGMGGFTTGAFYPLPGVVLAGSLLVADVNRDGIPDLLAASAIGASAAEFTSYLTVLTGQGDGTFTPLPSTVEPTEIYGMAAADFRGSGTVDLVQYLYPIPDVVKATGLAIQNTSMTIRAGNGDGTFQSPIPLTVPAGYVPFWFDMVARDFNGDGLPDLAFTVSPPTSITEGPSGESGVAVVAEAYQALPAGNLVVLLNDLPVPPTITSVVNGASFLPGIESGSWVTIKGTNLSNTNPGRIWTSSEIVNGNLPTSLDNTSVSIDGNPAFVYYISPTQLNVQAPNDSTTGTVKVDRHQQRPDQRGLLRATGSRGARIFPVFEYQLCDRHALSR